MREPPSLAQFLEHFLTLQPLGEMAPRSPARLVHTGCWVRAAPATWFCEDAITVHAGDTASRDSLSFHSEM